MLDQNQEGSRNGLVLSNWHIWG